MASAAVYVTVLTRPLSLRWPWPISLRLQSTARCIQTSVTLHQLHSHAIVDNWCRSQNYIAHLIQVTSKLSRRITYSNILITTNTILIYLFASFMASCETALCLLVSVKAALTLTCLQRPFCCLKLCNNRVCDKGLIMVGRVSVDRVVAIINLVEVSEMG